MCPVSVVPNSNSFQRAAAAKKNIVKVKSAAPLPFPLNKFLNDASALQDSFWTTPFAQQWTHFCPESDTHTGVVCVGNRDNLKARTIERSLRCTWKTQGLPARANEAMDYDFVSCLDDPGEKLPALEGFFLFAIIMYDKFSSKLILKVNWSRFHVSLTISFSFYLFLFI